MAKTPPYPYRVPRGYRYCRGIAAYVPPAYPFLAKKKTFPVRVWYGSDRDKTEPKQHRFRVNLKRILSSPPDSQPLVLFSATPLSLFSAFDSLCLSLPHSIAGALGSLFLTSSLYRQRATERKGRLWRIYWFVDRRLHKRDREIEKEKRTKSWQVFLLEVLRSGSWLKLRERLWGSVLILRFLLLFAQKGFGFWFFGSVVCLGIHFSFRCVEGARALAACAIPLHKEYTTAYN